MLIKKVTAIGVALLAVVALTAGCGRSIDKGATVAQPDGTYMSFAEFYVRHLNGPGRPAMAPGGVLPLGRNQEDGK